MLCASLFAYNVGMILSLLFNAVLSAPTVNSIVDRSLSVTHNWHVVHQWPRNTLTYCYENDEAQKALEPFFEAGWRLWRDQPNFPPHLGKNPIECPYKNLDTLVISLNRQEKIVTSLGYVGGTEQTMSIDAKFLKKGGNGDPVRTLAHEIGHALGLIHEHQKNDAKDYVTFKCENLEGYGDMSKAIAGGINSDGSPLTENNVCTSIVLARRYNFSAKEFIAWDGPAGSTVASPGFDFDSIMLYSSNFGGKRTLGIRKDVLTRKDNNKSFKAGKVPSQTDIHALNVLYP